MNSLQNQQLRTVRQQDLCISSSKSISALHRQLFTTLVLLFKKLQEETYNVRSVKETHLVIYLRFTALFNLLIHLHSNVYNTHLRFSTQSNTLHILTHRHANRTLTKIETNCTSMGRISVLLNICVVSMILLSKTSLADVNDDSNIKREINCTAVLIEKANKMVSRKKIEQEKIDFSTKYLEKKKAMKESIESKKP